LHQPGAGTALRFRDFARRHFSGNLAAAMRRVLVPLRGGEIEPFMRFDHVAGHAMAAGGKGAAQFEQRMIVACVCQRAIDVEIIGCARFGSHVRRRAIETLAVEITHC